MVTLFDLYSLLDTALYQWVYAFAFLFWVYPITWPYEGKGYKKDSKLFGVPCTPLVRWATAFLQCKRLNPRPTHKFFDQRSTQTWGGWEGKLVNLEEREFVLKIWFFFDWTRWHGNREKKQTTTWEGRKHPVALLWSAATLPEKQIAQKSLSRKETKGASVDNSLTRQHSAEGKPSTDSPEHTQEATEKYAEKENAGT